MEQQKIIENWYESLLIAEKMNLKIFRNMQSEKGSFTISDKSKEIYKSSDIHNALAFLKGIEYSNIL